MTLVPQRFALCSGIGFGKTKITAFDAALIDAGIVGYSLIKISSILPPGCERCSEILLPAGAVVHSAYGNIADDKQGVIASATAIAIPRDSSQFGIIMECSHHGDKRKAEAMVLDMIDETICKRKIVCDNILCISAEAEVREKTGYASAFAGVILW